MSSTTAGGAGGAEVDGGGRRAGDGGGDHHRGGASRGSSPPPRRHRSHSRSVSRGRDRSPPGRGRGGGGRSSSPSEDRGHRRRSPTPPHVARRREEEERYRRGGDRDYRGGSEYRERDYRRSTDRYGDRDRYGGGGGDRYRGGRDGDRGYSRSRSRYDSPPRDRAEAAAPKGSSVMDLLQRVIGGGLTASVLGGMAAAGGAGAPSAAAPAAQGMGATPATGMVLPPGMSMGVVPTSITPAMAMPTVAGIPGLTGMGTTTMGGGLGMGGFAMPQPASNLPSAMRVNRELYIGGLPPGSGLTAPQLKDFFNMVMKQAGLFKGPGDPCCAARVADTGQFAFVEFRTPEECDMALTLNGVELLGAKLRINRPKGYTGAISTPMPGMGMGMGMGMVPGMMPGMVPGMVPGVGMPAGMVPMAAANPATLAPGVNAMGVSILAPVLADPPVPGVLLVSNLATFVNAEGVETIMRNFGEIVASQTIPAAPGAAPGTQRALVSFRDPTVVDLIIASMNNVPIGDLPMHLSKAPTSLVHSYAPALLPGGSAAPAPGAPTSAPPGLQESQTPTTVLELTNIAVVRDLLTSEDAESLREDVSEECSKHGRVLEVFTPPLTPAHRAPGAELTTVPVFLLFDDITHAQAVAKAVTGRRFEGRTVTTRYVTPDSFAAVHGAGKADSGSHSGDMDDVEDEAAAKATGGASTTGHGHYASVAVPPPSSYQTSGGGSNGANGAPEDGLTLPPVPAAADLD